MNPSFIVNESDRLAIRRIAARVLRESPNMYQSQFDCELDLRAAKAQGCNIDFAKLEFADKFNFWHDIGGIAKNINRKTGHIENCFLPRTARG